MPLPPPLSIRAGHLHARASRTHRGRCGPPLPLPLREGNLLREPRMTDDGAVWDVRGLRKLFPLKAGLLDALRGREKQVHAVDGIDFSIKRSEILGIRSEEHTSELQSPCNLVCRLLLEKKKIKKRN